jgi:hypothetical protein
MSPYASNLRQSVFNSTENHSSSTSPRSSSRKLATRSESNAASSRLTSARLALESFWDLGVLDRLHAPLTHYHE